MKQKIATRAIVKENNKILLLRRSGGRPSIAGLYELPGGRIHFNQQPEDALAHAFRIHLSVSPETVQLSDVLSFIDPDDRQVQYIFIVFEASLESSDRIIELSEEHDKYVWKKMSDIHHNELTHSTQQILGLQPIPFTTGSQPTEVVKDVDKKTTLQSVIVYSDGGSRGNPGPSAAGFVVLDTSEQVVAEGGAYLDITTNNVAEYQAVYLGLEKALEMGARQVDFRMDSQLVANQMNGIYKIKHPDLKPIHHRIAELAKRFDEVTFTHVRREYNTLADGMVNKILDAHSSHRR